MVSARASENLSAAVRYSRKLGTACFNCFLDVYLSMASHSMNKELARRNAERGHNSLRWFTPEEAVVAEALANIIVPSDEETPGLDDVDVLGPPAIVSLDDLVMTFPDRQQLYARGLLAFDTWAFKERRCKFAEMPKEYQITLLGAAQRSYEDWTRSRSAFVKAWHRLRSTAQARSGEIFAAQLYSQIRDDCLQIFYTSRVSWVWLNYDGPPMDQGYPSLIEPR